MTTPTAEESRALLERFGEKQWEVLKTDLAAHLSAALDREAEALHRAKRAEADKFKMRDERDKAKIVANNYGNFAHDARKRAEEAEAERDAARAEVERLREALKIAADRLGKHHEDTYANHEGSISRRDACWWAQEARAALANQETDR